MARACPHCGERIDRLKYSCGTTGWETGTVSDRGNWDCDDSGTDDTHNYEYFCPECDTRIRESSDWIEGEDEDEDNSAKEAVAVPTEWSNLV